MIRVVIVDDEYLARQIIEKYIEEIPFATVVASIENPLELVEILRNTEVDLLFADIQMPQITGDKLIKSIKNPPLTVFTTAYSDYAVEAFELDVIDYLLKPFSFERFLKAVNKANLILKSSESSDELLPQKQGQEFLTIKSDGALNRIPLGEILYFESDREYVKIYTKEKRYIYLETLINLEDSLPVDDFLRVHKSYIISKAKVSSLNGNMLKLGEADIPISRSKRNEIIEKIFGRKV